MKDIRLEMEKVVQKKFISFPCDYFEDMFRKLQI